MVKISFENDPLKFTVCEMQGRHKTGILHEGLLITCIIFMLM